MHDHPPAARLGRCLVAGGAGYLGGSLTRELLRLGHSVRAVDRRPIELSHPRLERVRGDLTDPAVADAACEGIDTVFHTASVMCLYGFARKAMREASYATNVVAVRNVLRAARRAGVARLVYTSSNVVTFRGTIIDGDESDPYVDEPGDLYTETKILGEKSVLEANDSGGLSTCAIRPGGIYGPGDTFLLPRVVGEWGRGRVVALIGDGSAISDTTYIDNLIEAEIAAASHLAPGSPVRGQAYNVTDGRPMNYFEFFRPLIEDLGLRYPRIRVPVAPVKAMAWTWEALYRVLPIPRPYLTRYELKKVTLTHYNSNDKARRDFGWEPAVGLDEAYAACKPYCRELLLGCERVDRPHVGWWVAILGGMTALGLLTFSPEAHALWTRHVTTLTPRWLLAAVFVLAVLTHVYKGLKAARLASRAGLSRTARAWGIQTFLLGFASLGLLRKRIDSLRAGREGAGAPG